MNVIARLWVGEDFGWHERRQHRTVVNRTLGLLVSNLARFHCTAKSRSSRVYFSMSSLTLQRENKHIMHPRASILERMLTTSIWTFSPETWKTFTVTLEIPFHPWRKDNFLVGMNPDFRPHFYRNSNPFINRNPFNHPIYLKRK